MSRSLITVTRKMLMENPEEAHKRCARYHALVKRENWSDDRGNLSRSVYAKGSTLYSFIMLNGALIESAWAPAKGT